MSLPAQIWLWQFMHVLVGGMPAKAESSTEVWQKRQSMPSSATWCWWLNGTGCWRARPTLVAYEERTNIDTAQPAPASRKTAPKMLTLDSVLKLRWKI